MLDLAGLPRGAFAGALGYNLARFQSQTKVFDYFLGAVLGHLEADAAWLRRTLRENRAVRENYDLGSPRLRDEDLLARFLRQERPAVPRGLLLAPVRVNGRVEALIGLERHAREFERGQGWALNRLTSVLAQDLTRREEERLTRVLDSIKEKVISELRPRDLAYQILAGLHQLLHYDHSAALLIHDSRRRLLRVEADKIAWTKAKSAFIGHEVPVTAAIEDALRYPASIATFPAREDREQRLEKALLDVLHLHRGDSLPKPTSVLLAPLFFDESLLGILKVAALERLPFDDHDRKVVERFLPAAQVALRNARERVNLEKQALEAEIRAGLSTLGRAVAHDVNNAVGSLLPLAEQVREDLQDGRTDRATLVADMDFVIEKAQLVKRIFSNMLRLGTERPRRGPVDVHAVVREMLPVLESQVGGSRATLALDLADGFPGVIFVKPHLERIVWNLVTNAAEALAEKGGTVSIRTRMSESEGPVLSVSDDGPGMER
ncbi:MAG TPA: GAF domain-containing protein, partial [Vicinamibacteria bacterium]|nr:GAF domain-containing protein [Vicinamibacteria bacterium]